VRILEVEMEAARRERDMALARRANEKRSRARFEAATAALQASDARVSRIRYELMRARTDERTAA